MGKSEKKIKILSQDFYQCMCDTIYTQERPCMGVAISHAAINMNWTLESIGGGGMTTINSLESTGLCWNFLELIIFVGVPSNAFNYFH